jgi:DNA-binding NarL/FixJ family response regulator
METARPIRVLLVEDQFIVRKAFRAFLESYPDIEVVGEAEDGAEAIRMAPNLELTVIVMDIALPKMDGITATRLIKENHPDIIVIGLSVSLQNHEVLAMKKAGAFETVRKDKAADDLYQAMKRAIVQA